MLLDQGQLCIVEVLGHISDNTGNDGSGDAEPFLPAAAPRPLLNAFKEGGSGGRDRGRWPSGHQLPSIKLPLEAVPQVSTSVPVIKNAKGEMPPEEFVACCRRVVQVEDQQ